MNLARFKWFLELCSLVGIKTLADLKIFEDEYRLTAPTGEQLISALEREVGLL